MAGLPERPRETYSVHRSKRRPAIVLAAPGGTIPEALVRRKAGRETQQTVLVAPFYGVESRADKRLGWHDAFVNRIKTVEYPQYHWDVLPVWAAARTRARTASSASTTVGQSRFAAVEDSRPAIEIVERRDVSATCDLCMEFCGGGAVYG